VKKNALRGHIVLSACLAAAVFITAVLLSAGTTAAATVSAPRVLSSGKPVTSIACPTALQCTATTSNQVLTFNPLRSTRPWARNPFKPRAMPINSIWCPQAALCVTISGQAVTTLNPQKFAYRAAKVIEPVTGEGLDGVRCPSRSECVFIDGFGDGITYNPLTGKLINKQMKLDGNEALTALACPSASECVALDDDGSEVTFRPVTGRRLHGAQIDPAVGLDAASGASDTELDAVSCSSTERCAAVDSQGGVVVFDPLGGATTPTVTSFTTPWKSVSCRATGLCVAVGSTGETLVGSTLSPHSWITHAVPGAADLTAVACPTKTECVLADSSGDAFLINPTAVLAG
jgi:hypothetical protein